MPTTTRRCLVARNRSVAHRYYPWSIPFSGLRVHWLSDGTERLSTEITRSYRCGTVELLNNYTYLCRFIQESYI